MEIDKKMVDYVANLSRIQLNDQQTETMQNELSKILKLMETLKAVDTEGIEPLSHVFSVTNVLRPDVVHEHFNRESLLQNAPDCTEEAFVVPKTVEV